jgi:hypothetical protein
LGRFTAFADPAYCAAAGEVAARFDPRVDGFGCGTLPVIADMNCGTRPLVRLAAAGFRAAFVRLATPWFVSPSAAEKTPV